MSHSMSHDLQSQAKTPPRGQNEEQGDSNTKKEHWTATSSVSSLFSDPTCTPPDGPSEMRHSGQAGNLTYNEWLHKPVPGPVSPARPIAPHSLLSITSEHKLPPATTEYLHWLAEPIKGEKGGPIPDSTPKKSELVAMANARNHKELKAKNHKELKLTQHNVQKAKPSHAKISTSKTSEGDHQTVSVHIQHVACSDWKAPGDSSSKKKGGCRLCSIM
eukprot:CAMPEP_0114557386 /NCGR_PEP_ID=MMETSP0114-20121206/9804_1 /TAXON_ID=31324 /ORGANISM="Goniomonas sp, Strain m" /LENGTH=216 /DNA_ID=CAMNT_0001742673 /DNA_START=51 /DNA_END=701 /DNA_ORIENTATION=-